jgi:hypothetical protein
MWQYIIITVVLALAVGYAVWRIRRTLQNEATCCGCEGCALKNQCCDKKTCEKFGQSKN